jgi:hypothetical protein
MIISDVRAAVVWAPLLCIAQCLLDLALVAEAVDATTSESLACAVPQGRWRPYSASELMIRSILTLATATCATAAAAADVAVQAKGELPLALPAAPHLVAADGSVKIPPKW